MKMVIRTPKKKKRRLAIDETKIKLESKSLFGQQ